MNLRRLGLLCLVVVLASGCATRQNVDEQAQENYQDPRDPLEDFNRTMWDFNYDVLDQYILRPMTVAYVDYMPQFARTGLLNAALNLEEPSNAVNNLLQGKLDGTLVSAGRFVINTTLGIFGLVDVATELGLTVEAEEFGETLGVYGVGTGPYLMLPAFGPSDPRSFAGDVVDNSYFPIGDLNFYFWFLRNAIEALEARAAAIPLEPQLEQSLDPYTFVKDAYLQNVEFNVKDGKVDNDDEDFEMDEDIDELLDDL